MEIRFYYREAELGDYVYHDGSYSPIPIRNRHLIGMCIYVNPNNRKERLLLGFEDISNAASWGLQNLTVILADDPTYNTLDLPLPNIAASGVDQGINEGTMSDPLSPDGIKAYPSISPYGDYGFITLVEDIAYGERQYKAGQSIPRGLYNSSIILKHRDKILKDSSINLGVPKATESETEMQSLERLMNEIVMKNSGNIDYQTYYYPAASYCHAYQPAIKEGFELSDKFKTGNWYLPGVGDLARACWLYIEGKFDKAINDGDFKRFVSSGATSAYHASTEMQPANAWNCLFNNHTINFNQGKRIQLSVRPVCAF